MVRPRRALHKALLDIEGAAGGGAERTLDERQGILFLQYCDGVARGAGERRGEALIEEVLNMADREGVWRYLESSREVPNLAI